MKKLIQFKLRIFAKLILAKYQPEIIGITGSIGKTSAREAIYAVLSVKYRARRSDKNYNNEYGVPLTIIGADSPGKNFFGWGLIFMKALGLLLFKNKKYPDLLILEMGVDRKGDMEYLTQIVKCKIGVVTYVSNTHLEHFGSVKNIAHEKGILVESLPSKGRAILNFDNPETRDLGKRSMAPVVSFGFNTDAKVMAEDLKFRIHDTGEETQIHNLSGISFKLHYDGSTVPVILPGTIGLNSVYAALAATAVGISMDMNLVTIAEALRSFKPPVGRMSAIQGEKNTMIIDDTYNASPASSRAALDLISKIDRAKYGRLLVALGDMLELGSESEAGHREIGTLVAKLHTDKLILVGARARLIGDSAEKNGMSKDNIFYFDDSATAGKFIEELIAENDLIFVKGSQGMRMERIVKEIMAEPMRAEELLVRQGRGWTH